MVQVQFHLDADFWLGRFVPGDVHTTASASKTGYNSSGTFVDQDSFWLSEVPSSHGARPGTPTDSSNAWGATHHFYYRIKDAESTIGDTVT